MSESVKLVKQFSSPESVLNTVRVGRLVKMHYAKKKVPNLRR